MARSSDRLMTVLKLAQRKQEAAAKQLAASQQQKDAMVQQQLQLSDYRGEYNRSFQDRAAAGYNPITLANYQRFYANLDGVVEAQHYRVADAEEQLDKAREQWQLCYAREKNLEKLIERKRKEEDLAQDKREQKLQDDRPVQALSNNPFEGEI